MTNRFACSLIRQSPQMSCCYNWLQLRATMALPPRPKCHTGLISRSIGLIPNVNPLQHLSPSKLLPVSHYLLANSSFSSLDSIGNTNWKIRMLQLLTAVPRGKRLSRAQSGFPYVIELSIGTRASLERS